MGDSELSHKEAASAPQWQQQPPPPETSGTTESSTASTVSVPRTELLEQASKFLEADDIREAPTGRKVAFLESKGLTNVEIQKLLGVSRNTPSGTSNEVASPPATQVETTQLPSGSGKALSPQPLLSSQSKHDVPPIVTYPEFLLPSPSPPPLLTARRLFTALYLAGAAAASIYSTSKYIVAPMTEQLTEARRSLGETAISNLRKLSEKLESTVSEIPIAERWQPMSLDNDEHAESVDSDPTECFHVDAGTQTSPSLSRRPSTSVSESGEIADKDAKVTAQERRLKSICSRLSEFVEGNNDIGEEETDAITSIQDLKTYLHGLTYSSPYYSNNIYGGLGGAGLSGVRNADGEDATAKMKSEIRGMKSVFLNAKNFPQTNNRGGLGAARAGVH